MKAGIKILKFLDETLDRLSDALLITVMLIGLFLVIDSKIVFDKASGKLEAFRPTSSESAGSLKELGPDVISWLYIYDSAVDFPIVQGKTNDEYLNKAYDGSYSLAGSIFLDIRNSPDFTDEYSLVYGHNVSNKAMFGSLLDFADKTFFDEHEFGEIVLKDGTYIDVQVVAFVETDANEQLIFDPQRPGDRLEYAKRNAKNYRNPVNSNRVIVLSTCKSPSSTTRHLVVLVEKERHKS